MAEDPTILDLLKEILHRLVSIEDRLTPRSQKHPERPREQAP